LKHRGIPKDDRLSRRRYKILKRHRRLVYCSCFHCLGKMTARWSKREAATLSEPVPGLRQAEDDLFELQHAVGYEWIADDPHALMHSLEMQP
jgi:hypothetical protein